MGINQVEELISRYSVAEPRFLRQNPRDKVSNTSFNWSDTDGVWRRSGRAAVNEAVIMCTGSIVYDRRMEQAARVGDIFEFRTAFRHIRRCLEQADLAVGSFGQLVADEYPALSAMPSKYAGGHYGKAHSSFLDAVSFAGFDCLALANPYNLDLGIRGLLSTERAAVDNGLIPSGLGVRKLPHIDVNGIRIAVLSYSLEQYRTESITAEGESALLSRFEMARVRTEITQAQSDGAQFVLGLLDCTSEDGKYGQGARSRAGQVLAECGADYVVCSLPGVVSRYERHLTEDGRDVPIATSLGTFVNGTPRPQTALTALLKITLGLDSHGRIQLQDSFVPVKKVEGRHSSLPQVVPMHEHYSRIEPEHVHSAAAGTVQARLGDGIAEDRSRRVTVFSHYQPQLTPNQIAEVLGAEIAREDLETLGDEVHRPVASIAVRKEDIKADGVAVIVKRGSTDRATGEAAKSAGARLAISQSAVPGLPTIVVDRAWDGYLKLMRHIRSLYEPLTIAVTGTAGKTTTKDLLGSALAREFRMLHTVGNGNTLRSVGNAIQKLTNSDEVFLQEVHEGTPGSASAISDLIRPSIAVITSVADGHLDQMGSFENVVSGNVGVIDGFPVDGVLVVNNDTEPLRRLDLPVEIVRYSLTDTECDYHARSIREVDEGIEFEIVSPDGVFEARINFGGFHNVSNALAAFAVARIAGAPPRSIIAGLSRYRPASQRQNLLEVGGYRVLLDAYNSNVLSMKSALDVLRSIPIDSGGRRVVVMGDMGEQGDKLQENHTLIGEYIAQSSVDGLLCTGEGSGFTAAAARSRGMDSTHVADTQDLVQAVGRYVRPGDAILFKAAGALNFTENVVYPLFGRIG